MNIVSKVTCFPALAWMLCCGQCRANESERIASSADFAALEEAVRSNTGEIEELKKQIAELKERIDQLSGSENKNSENALIEKERQAVGEFIKRYKEAKGHNGEKAAEALYKLAQSFRKLGDAKKAKTTLEKLASDYPSSSFGERAKKELKNLK